MAINGLGNQHARVLAVLQAHAQGKRGWVRGLDIPGDLMVEAHLDPHDAFKSMRNLKDRGLLTCIEHRQGDEVSFTAVRLTKQGLRAEEEPAMGAQTEHVPAEAIHLPAPLEALTHAERIMPVASVDGPLEGLGLLIALRDRRSLREHAARDLEAAGDIEVAAKILESLDQYSDLERQVLTLIDRVTIEAR